MKATGEVMAIDRTFGAALNKALRGLEQAGAGPLAEDPRWAPTFDYLAGGLRPATRDADEPIRWIDERGEACESTRSRAAVRGADRAAAVPRAVRLAGCGGCSRCSAAACRRRSIGEATGIAPWFLAEMGRNVALEAETPAMGARRWPTPRDAEAAELLATAKRAGFGDRDLAGLAGIDRRTSSARRARRSACARATRWSTRAPRSSRPRRRTSTRPTPRPARRPRRRRSPRPAALVIGCGPVRIGQGIEFDYCAVQAADTLRRSRLAGGDGQLEPGDRLDRLRRLVAAVLRAARPRERAQRHRRRVARTATRPAAGDGRVRRPDAAQPGRAAGRRRRRRCSAATSRRSTRRRSGPASRRCSTGSASRSPRAAWPTSSRRR